MQRTQDDLGTEQEHLVVLTDVGGELVTAQSEIGGVLLPSLSVSREQTLIVEVVTPDRSSKSFREDLLTALWIYLHTRFGNVCLIKGESTRVLEDILTVVPSLRSRTHVGLLTQFYLFYKKVSLERGAEQEGRVSPQHINTSPL